MLRKGIALICAFLMILSMMPVYAREGTPARPSKGKVAVPVRTPEPVFEELAAGARGDEVIKLQQRLAVLGFFFTAEDGIYGANTQSAVREFENYLRLLEQDEIDRMIEANKTPEPTLAPQATIEAEETKLPEASSSEQPENTAIPTGTPEMTIAPTPAPTAAQTVEPTAVPTPAPTPVTVADGTADVEVLEYLYGEADELYRRDASLNDKGADVTRVQRALVRLNYLNDEPDGVFGINTENAVKAFQLNHDMNATGVADRSVQKILFSLDAYRADKPVYNQLYLGVTGEDVKALQRQLRLLGFTNSKVSGTFDEKTQTAVKLLETHLHQLELQQQGAALIEPEGTSVPEAVLENQGTVEGDPETNPYEILPEDTEATQVPPELTEESPQPGEGGTQTAGQASAAPPNPLENESPQPQGEATAAPEAVQTEEPAETDGFVPTGIVPAEMQVLLLEEGIPVYLQTLEKGDSGEQVQRIQRRLYSLGYLTANGVDGIFGKGTHAAVVDFQNRNGQQMTGIADQAMQSALFSEDAIKGMKPYQIKISVDKQRVYVYTYDANDEYSILVQEFKCSTGTKSNPTPLGTFTNTGPGARWHYFKKFECWAQYAYYIENDIMFHSVLYDEKDEDTLRKGSVSALGSRASHGCIRLQVEDAKWIYENCKAGTTVIVY